MYSKHIKKFTFFSLLTPLLAYAEQCQTNCDSLATSADYVIVGAGTAGATLAYYLSNDKKTSVLVIEEGQNFNDDPNVLTVFDPSSPAAPWKSEKYSQKLAVDDPTVGPISFGNGIMWGGSSGHHFLLDVWGDNYNEWAVISGDNGWNQANANRYFKFLETYIGGSQSPEMRGNSGPINVLQSPPVFGNQWAEALAQATGSPVVLDYNVTSLATSSFQSFLKITNFNPFTLIRSFAGNAFLNRDVVTHDGFGIEGRKLRVLSECVANKVCFSGNKAIAVEYLDTCAGITKKAYARKKVILAAGTQTPAILQRSGVGPKELLDRLEIPAVVYNENVGHNFLYHYGATATYSFQSSDLDSTNAFVHLTSKPLPLRQVQLISTAPANSLNPPATLAPIPADTIASSTIYWLLDPRSYGRIEIVSRNPLNPPNIFYNLYSDGGLDDPESDASLIVKTYRLIAQTAQLAGRTLYYPSPEAFESDEKLLKAAYAGSVVANHYGGTCRMAQSAQDGVVDGTLHVFGTKNLMVADLSASPKLPAGNTAQGAFFIGARAATILGAHVIM